MSSLRIGSIRGIEIEAHSSWLIFLGVVTCLLAIVYFPERFEGPAAVYWLLGIAGSALLFVTVVIHELAHAFVATRRGLAVPRITVYMFGGLSHLPRPPRTPGEEFAISAAGPAVTVVLGLITLGAAFLAGWRDSPLGAMLLYVAAVNFVLAVFNSMPGFPLDGGAMLRSIIWKRTGSFSKATKVVRNTGDLAGFAAVVAAVVLLVMAQWGFAVAAGGLGVFLLMSSRLVRGAGDSPLDHALNRLTARDVMSRRFVEVTPETPIQHVVDEYMIERGEHAVVVASGDQVAGILTIDGLTRVARPHWPATPVQRAMTPRGRIRTIDSDVSAADIMPLLALGNFSHIPVLDEGRMIGLITRDDFFNRIILAEILGDGEAKPAAAEASDERAEPPAAEASGDQGDSPGGPAPR